MPMLIFCPPLLPILHSCVLSTYYAHNSGDPQLEWIGSQLSTSESMELKEAGLSQYGLCYYRPVMAEYCIWVNNGRITALLFIHGFSHQKLPFKSMISHKPEQLTSSSRRQKLIKHRNHDPSSMWFLDELQARGWQDLVCVGLCHGLNLIIS